MKTMHFRIFLCKYKKTGFMLKVGQVLGKWDTMHVSKKKFSQNEL